MSLDAETMMVAMRRMPADKRVFRATGYKQMHLSWQSKQALAVFTFDLMVIVGNVRSDVRKHTTGRTSTEVFTLYVWERGLADHLRWWRGIPQSTLRVSATPANEDWWNNAYYASVRTGMMQGIDQQPRYEHPPINHAELMKIARAAVNKTMPASVLVDYVREMSPVVEQWIAAPEIYVSN